ncbi:MAG: hypothetical protein HAW61_04370 [Candidatus Portiera sp.]|nr:hypothetical protein [Portiera sp.]
MSEMTEALILAGVGFSFVFLFLGCLVISLLISSRIFGWLNKDATENESAVAAVAAAVKHHNRKK